MIINLLMDFLFYYRNLCLEFLLFKHSFFPNYASFVGIICNFVGYSLLFPCHYRR